LLGCVVVRRDGWRPRSRPGRTTELLIRLASEGGLPHVAADRWYAEFGATEAAELVREVDAVEPS
jgi:hypothetical protein